MAMDWLGMLDLHDSINGDYRRSATRMHDRREALKKLPAPDGLAADTLGLAHVGKRAAGLIERHGWVQSTMRNHAGAMCLHGALREATAADGHPGDFPILSMVFHRRGNTMGWNDSGSRSREEVIAALEAEPVTDDELTALLGPEWVSVIGVLRTAPTLSHVERTLLSQAVADLSDRFSVETVAKLVGELVLNRPDLTEAMSMLGWTVRRELSTVLLKTWRVGMHSASNRVAEAVAITVVAVALRPFLRERGERELYDAMTLPWRSTVGPLHLADPPVPTVAPLCGDTAPSFAGLRDQIAALWGSQPWPQGPSAFLADVAGKTYTTGTAFSASEVKALGEKVMSAAKWETLGAVSTTTAAPLSLRETLTIAGP